MAIIKLTRASNGKSVYISERGFGFAKTKKNGQTSVFYFSSNTAKSVRVSETPSDISKKSDSLILLDSGGLVLDINKIDSAIENNPSGSVVFYSFQGKIFTISNDISELFSKSNSTSFRYSKEITSNYTVGVDDYNSVLVVNSSSSVTITIDDFTSSGISVNAEIEIFRMGTGDVSIISSSGVYINNVNQATETLSKQYDGILIKQTQQDFWYTIRRNCCGVTPTFAFGNALYFRNQDNTYITIPSYSVDTSSISMWFYIPTGLNAYFLLGRDDATLGYVQIKSNVTPNEIICAAGSSPTSATFISPESNLRSNWNHMAIVRDGTNMDIYINSVKCTDYKVGSGSTQSTPAPIGVMNINVIGGYNTAEITGWLNEIAIWDSAITAQNVSDLYNSGNGNIADSVVANPVRYYRFNLDSNGNEQTGTTLIDLGSDGSDGTLVNFTTPDDWVNYTTANG